MQDQFFERHGVKLGFMSAFVKAAADALREVPAVNGVIDGDEIIYRQAGRREGPGCIQRLQLFALSAAHCFVEKGGVHIWVDMRARQPPCYL